MTTAIRLAILIFYFLDYLHLYGDMDALIRDPDKKSLGYFVVDIVTCFSYLAAFIALKIPRYWPSFLVFGIVPWLFLFYKRKNIHDRKFLKPYGYVAILILTYRGLCRLIPALTLLTDQVFVLLFVVGNAFVYGVYVFHFYEKASRRYDAEILYRENGRA